MIDILETTKDLHMVFAQIPSHTFLKVYTKTSLKTVTTHNQFVDRLGYVWWQKPTRHCRDFKRSNKKLCGSLEFCALSIYRGYKIYKQRCVVKWLDYYPCAPCNNAILPSKLLAINNKTILDSLVTMGTKVHVIAVYPHEIKAKLTHSSGCSFSRALQMTILIVSYACKYHYGHFNSPTWP